jgi:signal transduction histidine kinase
MEKAVVVANVEPEEDRQVADTLSTLMRVSWGILLFVIIASLFYQDWKTIAATLAACCLMVIPFVLLKRRQLRASSLVFMFIVLGIVTLIATVGQGILDLAIVGFPIIFIFAGLVLDRLYFRVCVVLTMAACCWLALDAAYGWFTTPISKGGLSNWLDMLTTLIILLGAAFAVNLLATNMRRNTKRAQTEIAQRKKAEEEVKQLNASLEQRVEERTQELRNAQEKLLRHEKLAVLGQMAGSVGHELRNPLSAINNAIYYLKLVQPEANEKIKKHHTLIEQEVHNADKIISDLLDFARSKSEAREQVSVAELVKQTLERFPVPAGIHSGIDLTDDLPMVFADPRQMVQVLGNLVTNACQAMADVGNLTISAQRQQGMVTIAVKDTGTGITPENMQKLFEPLFTTKTKGIGLGLAVSRKLAEANGGRIEVISVPDKGSTFTLVLPVEAK